MKAANLTIVEIHATINVDLDDENDPYYQRTILSPRIVSSAKFGRVSYKHLGFPSPGHGRRTIRLVGDKYICIGTLDPNADVHLIIPPFKIILENLGDSFMGVHIRLPAGKEHCKISILQEKHQPKAVRLVDDFIEYESVWYATATVNCLQTLRIEELKGDS